MVGGGLEHVPQGGLSVMLLYMQHLMYLEHLSLADITMCTLILWNVIPP